MNELFKQAMSLGLVGKCVAAIIGILIIHGGFHLLEQTLPRRFGRADARYKVRKFVVFTGYLAILLFLAILFEDRLGRLSFALGVAGAGVAAFDLNQDNTFLEYSNGEKNSGWIAW